MSTCCAVLCCALLCLCRFDFLSWDIIEHSHHPVDWNLLPEQQPHPLAAKEPRRGRRLSLAADVATRQGPLRVYCCHLEVCAVHGHRPQSTWVVCLLDVRSLSRCHRFLLAGTQAAKPHNDSMDTNWGRGVYFTCRHARHKHRGTPH
jgi:hypothetical protein